MKLSFAALAVAAMAGSASADTLVFTPPIPYTQFDGDCGDDVLYIGGVDRIKKLDYGSFCITDVIDNTDGTTANSYSRVDIASCRVDYIYENWYGCDDSDCTSCDLQYHAKTNWDSIGPVGLVGYCYDYHISVPDLTTSTARAIEGSFVGSFEEEYQINFSFNSDAIEDDTLGYVEFMDSNSCIADGKPTMDAIDPPPTTTTKDVTQDEDEGEEADADADISGDTDMDSKDSGASTLAATAAVAMAAATAMLLA